MTTIVVGADDEPRVGAREWATLATLTMTTMLYAMTVTIANVSLPQMQGTLSATQDQIAWIVTFNIVATAVATPTTGWLVARFGRRNVMVYGVLGFTISSFLCGAADSLTSLVIYRIAQGLFGAPLVPLSQAITLDTFPLRLRAKAMATFGVGVVIGPIFAPTVGGLLSEAYGWRWVFYMIVPFGLVALVGVWLMIQDKRREANMRLDWIGFLALSFAVGALQLMLDRGERNDWFEATEILAYAVLALVAAYIFFVHSLTTSRPFLDLSLLVDRNYSLGLTVALIFGMLNFTPMVLLPPLLQNLQNYPDSVIGLVLAARGFGTLIGFAYMFVGSRLDPRINLAFGFLSQGIAGYAMSQFDINVTMFDVLWTSAVQGLGVGFIWVPLTMVAFKTIPPAKLEEGSAIFHLMRNIGSSIYISISVAVVIRSTKVNYSEMSVLLTPFRKALEFVGSDLLDPTSTSGLAMLSGEVQRQALMIGYLNAFFMFSITAFAIVPLLLLFRQK